jgi:hypothetical protein
MDVSKLLNPVSAPTLSPTGAAGRTDAMGAMQPAAQAVPHNRPRVEQFAVLAGGTPPRTQSGSRAPRGTGPARTPEGMSSRTLAPGVRPGGDATGQSSAGGPVRLAPRSSPHFHPYEPGSRASAGGSSALPAGGPGLAVPTPANARQPAPTARFQGGLPPPGAVGSSSTALVPQPGQDNPLDLTADEHHRIGHAKGGSGILEYLDHHHQELLETLDRDKIVQIAARDGGSRALQAVLDFGPALRAADFADADIARIAGNAGSAQTLPAMLAFVADPDAPDLENADIVRIAANIGGARALEAVLNLGPALRAANFSNADIVGIAGNNGGAQALQAVRDVGPALRAADFAHADIVRVASTIGGAPALRRVAEHLSALRDRGYSDERIVGAARARPGSAGHIGPLGRSRR